MFNLSETWVIICVVIAVISVLGRFAYSRYTGKEIDNSYTSTINEIRNKIIIGLNNAVNLSKLEKEKGREVVRKEIASQISNIIDDTSLLTNMEKELIINFNTAYFVEIVEKELIRAGILKE